MLLCNVTALRNLSIKAQSKACTHYRLFYGKHACMAQIGLKSGALGAILYLS